MTVKASESWEAVSFAADGLTGATAASRYVGATASGAPTTGAFLLGDWVVSQNGHMWVCTVAGSPGAWVDVAGAGGVTLGSAAPLGLGTAAAGTSGSASHQDHVHPGTASAGFTVTGGVLSITPATANTFGLIVNGGATADFAGIDIVNAAATFGATLGVVQTATHELSDSTVGDTTLTWSAGLALRLGVINTASILQITQTDVQINDNGTARSVPRGVIGIWAQGATSGTNISASALEVALFSGVGGFSLVSGRRYRFWVRINGTVTTASTTARLIFFLKLGTGTGGTALAEHIVGIPSSASALAYLFFGEGVAGTDFAAGTSAVSITGQFSSSNTFTVLGASQPPNISALVLVEDIGT